MPFRPPSLSNRNVHYLLAYWTKSSWLVLSVKPKYFNKIVAMFDFFLLLHIWQLTRSQSTNGVPWAVIVSASALTSYSHLRRLGEIAGRKTYSSCDTTEYCWKAGTDYVSLSLIYTFGLLNLYTASVNSVSYRSYHNSYFKWHRLLISEKQNKT